MLKSIGSCSFLESLLALFTSCVLTNGDLPESGRNMGEYRKMMEAALKMKNRSKINFDIRTLGLTPYSRQRVLEASAAVELAPSSIQPYLDLAQELQNATHARLNGVRYGNIRRLHYLAGLLDVLVWVKERENAPELRKGDDASGKIPNHLEAMHRETMQELHRTIFSGGSIVLPTLSCCSPAIHIAIAAVGDYGEHAAPTLNSLVLRSSSPVHVHVLSDSAGWQGVTRALQQLPEAVQNRLTMKQVAFLENPQFLKLIDNLPMECRNGWPGTLLGYMHNVHLFLHEVLADSIERVAFVDIGDVLFLGDIVDLWSEFERFTSSEIGAVAVEGGFAYLDRFANGFDVDNLDLWTSSGDVYSSTKRANPAGLSLWDLAKARASNWTATVIEIMKPLGPEGCDLACMDVATQVFRRRPDLWKPLSNVWHFYPEVPWEYTKLELQALFTSQVPIELKGLRVPFGLLSAKPLVMENPCPPLPLQLASTLLANRFYQTLLEQASWVKRAYTIEKIGYIEQYWGKAFSYDLRCNTRIRALHATGFSKTESWAQVLFHIWGRAPPSRAQLWK